MRISEGIESIEARIIQQIEDTTGATGRRRDKHRLELLRTLRTADQEVEFEALPPMGDLEREEQMNLDRLDALEKGKERLDKAAGKMVKWIIHSLDTHLQMIFQAAMADPTSRKFVATSLGL